MRTYSTTALTTIVTAAVAVGGLLVAPSATAGTPGAPVTWAQQLGGSGHPALAPSGVDVDPQNRTVFVADTGNDAIAAYAAGGVLLWRTGGRSAAVHSLGRFGNPRDVAYWDGLLYVADLGNNRVQVLDAGTGAAIAAWPYKFSSLIGISAGRDASGRAVVLTADNNVGVIRVFAAGTSGDLLYTVGSGTGSGPGQLDGPRDAAVDSAGNVYVADFANNRIVKFGPDGGFVTAWGSRGTAPGQFGRPYGIDVDDTDQIYVADSNNGRIQVFDVDGGYQGTYGAKESSYTPGSGRLFGLRRVAVGGGPQPAVYAADLWGFRILRYDGTPGGTDAASASLGDQPASAGAYNEAYGADADSDALFVADTDNQRVQRLSADGTAVEAVWGDRGFGEGNPGFNWPRDLTIDRVSGTVWVADTKNNRLQEFTRDGSPTGRTLGRFGGGPTELWWPHAVAATDTGLLAVADTNNNRVSLWDPATGAVVWVATGLDHPKDVSVSGGRVVVADSLGRRVVVLALTDGSQLASLGEGVLHRPEGVAVDADGSVWVSDTPYNRILQLAPDGRVLSSFGGAGSEHGQFNAPTHLTLRWAPDGSRQLIVNDTWNDRIEVFTIQTS